MVTTLTFKDGKDCFLEVSNFFANRMVTVVKYWLCPRETDVLPACCYPARLLYGRQLLHTSSEPSRDFFFSFTFRVSVFFSASARLMDIAVILQESGTVNDLQFLFFWSQNKEDRWSSIRSGASSRDPCILFPVFASFFYSLVLSVLLLHYFSSFPLTLRSLIRSPCCYQTRPHDC